jgi:hypothetical protein
LNQIYHKLDMVQVLVAAMIKSLLSCNQERARARRPWNPFSGSREVSWARSMNQGFDPSRANARNPSIQYFYAFLVRRTLRRRQNGLVALRANGWE